MMNYPVVKEICLGDFVCVCVRVCGCDGNKKGGGRFSLLGHGVCGGSGQRDVVDLPRVDVWTCAHPPRHTRVHMLSLSIYCFYLLLQSNGRGKQEKDMMSATKSLWQPEWSGNTSGGGHFSCGVCLCLHRLCVLDALSGKGCNKFGQSAELV